MSQQIPGDITQYNKSCRHFAKRMGKTPKSFIREILKVTEDPLIISFAGGLPNPALIDVNGISRAATTVLREDGSFRTPVLNNRRISAAPSVHCRALQKTSWIV